MSNVPRGTSALPDDPAYWDRLARRIEMAARTRYARPTETWLARRARGLCVAAGAIAAAVSFIVIARPLAPPPSADRLDPGVWTAAVGPSEPLGQWLTATRSPTIATVVVGTAGIPQRTTSP